MRIILLTRGTGGDFYPFVRIGKALKKHGHEIIFMTHGYYGKEVLTAGLDFAPIDQAESFEDLLGHTPTNNFKDFAAGLKQGIPSLLTGYEAHHQIFERKDTLLLAHSNTHLAAQFISEKHDIPIVSIFAAPHTVKNMVFWEEIYLAASDELNRIRAVMDLPPIYDWRSWWRTVPYNIGLWPEWFAAPDSSWPVKVQPVGFILNEPTTQPLPEEAEQILSNSIPTLLVTHATSTTSQSQFFNQSIEACQALGWQAILVSPHRNLLPQHLPSQTYHFPALPFNGLLPRVNAVIHHGGIGTLAQAIAAGVPQLILGAGFDRPDNAIRAEKLGIARYLPSIYWQANVIAHTLQRLTSSPEIREHCRQFSLQIVYEKPLEMITHIIKSVADSFLWQVTTSNPPTSHFLPKATTHRHSTFAYPTRLESLTQKERAYLALRLRQKNMRQHNDTNIT